MLNKNKPECKCAINYHTENMSAYLDTGASSSLLSLEDLRRMFRLRFDFFDFCNKQTE